MTVSRILSSAATIHSARAYVKPGQTVSAMFNAHNERRASVGLALSALLADDRSMYLPRFDAGPYSDRYRHELQFIGLVFQDDLTAEWLYRNVQMEEQQLTTLAKHGSETMRAAERTHAQPGASQSHQAPAPRPQSRQQG